LITAPAYAPPGLGDAIAEAYQLKVLRQESLGRVHRIITDRGPRLAVLLSRSPEGAELVAQVYEYLGSRSWDGLPRHIKTSSGDDYLMLEPRLGVLLTQAPSGRPAQAGQHGFAAGAAGLLAQFHHVTREFAPPVEGPGRDLSWWCSEMRSRSEDLAAYELVARHRLRQGLFDQFVLSLGPRLRLAAQKAVEHARAACAPGSASPRTLSAGDFALAEIRRLPGEKSSATRLGFLALPACVAAPTITDLARLVRQIALETGWRPSAAWSAISAYERRLALAASDKEFILAYAGFPFEACGVIDQYYRKRQGVPEREAVGALTAAVRGEAERQTWVQQMARRLGRDS
jgi:hypothetical protein